VKLPNYQEKQRILYLENRSERELIDFGDRYLEAGRISDAVDFYQKALYVQGLEKIRQISEAAGDVMLFQNVMKALGLIVAGEEWDRMGRRASDLGKYAFAMFAFEKSGNNAMLEETKEMLKKKEKKNNQS
jgi:heme oxygenase